MSEAQVIPGLATTAPGDIATAQGSVEKSGIRVCVVEIGVGSGGSEGARFKAGRESRRGR